MTGYQTGSNSFSLDLSKFAAKANVDMVLVIKKIVLELFTRVIYRTPVDTGALRGNWGVGIGSYTPQADPQKTDKGGSQTVGQASNDVLNWNADGSIFLTNHLSYAYKIEYEGWSKVKAPAGMVRVSIEEISGFLTKANIGSVKGQSRGN